MTKRFIFVCLFLLLTPILVFAQDEEAETEDIPYLRLNSNFSVPEVRGWDATIEGATVLFSRNDIQAQIYVRIVDTLDTALAIDAAIADVEQISLEVTDAIYEGRIGLDNGTWNYQMFKDGDTSLSAYALLQSNQVYVVLFAEENPDFDAYHFAIRSAMSSPTTSEEINEATSTIALEAINHLRDTEFTGDATTTRMPIESNERWIEASYADDLTTLSYIQEDDNIVFVTVVDGNPEFDTDLSDSFILVLLNFVITPDNSEYLYLGLGIFAAIMLGLIGSMYLRYQNLKKDIQVLEQLADDES